MKLLRFLPEGVLRAYMVKRLRIYRDHEFDIFAALGASLPGAVRALAVNDLPPAAIHYRPGASHAATDDTPIKFLSNDGGK